MPISMQDFHDIIKATFHDNPPDVKVHNILMGAFSKELPGAAYYDFNSFEEIRLDTIQVAGMQQLLRECGCLARGYS